MKKVVKKLWKGNMVSVRDYEVRKCIANDQPLRVHYKDDCMTVDVARLKRLNSSGQFVKSKTGGQNYSLVDIFWEPDIINKHQAKLL